MGDYSRLLTKMGELQTITSQYEILMNTHKPAYSVETRAANGSITGYTDTYIARLNKNAISTTIYPLVIRPGEDYGEFWKYIGEVTPATTPTGDANAAARRLNSARNCWHLAAGNPRLFQKVVYTGTQNTNEPSWNNRCYGLVPDVSGSDIPPSVLNVDTDSLGYVSMVGNGNTNGANDIYTKLGIKSSDSVTQKTNVANAMKINDLQLRINGLTREIVAEADAGINNDLDKLVSYAADSDAIISKINDYMNDGVGEIEQNYGITGKRKELSNIYADINEQTTLRSRKYQFVFYVIVFVLLVIVYWSYTSKMTVLEQYDMLQNYVGWEWWTYWWIIATVVILFVISTIGWDIKGYIITAMNYLTDPSFWTGQLWWVGISFLMLIVIFFYATFKSFFSGIGDGLTNAVTGELGGRGGGGEA
jgi:hypothetical protein